MLRSLRFHGRGGEGVKVACRIASRAAFLAGATVQDSPLYGAERRGAPVLAFARIGDGPIRERGYITAPDLVVVMDASLLEDRDAGVLEGVTADTAVLVNSARAPAALARRWGLAGPVACLDLSALALELIGAHVLSAAAAAFAVRAGALAGAEQLAAAVERELTDAGVGGERVARNQAVARAVFARAPRLPFGALPAAPPSTDVPPLFRLPHISATLAAPSITVARTSARRHTDGWRLSHPVLDRARCTRCLICLLLCPEGAIALDTEGLPAIDDDHCKGCLICVAECRPGALQEVREAAP